MTREGEIESKDFEAQKATISRLMQPTFEYMKNNRHSLMICDFGIEALILVSGKEKVKGVFIALSALLEAEEELDKEEAKK